MRGTGLLIAGLFVVSAMAAAPVNAQVIFYQAPVVQVAPVTAYYPPTVAVRGGRAATYYAPAAVAAPVAVTTYYAPSVPVAVPAVRTTSYYSSVSSMPMATVNVAQPVVTYYPPAVAAPPSYVIGRGVVGQTKVYIPGQPVRNSVRFVTP